MYQAATAGAALLDNLGLPWWASHGSLYGSWCFHGIIPWDDDLDFAFPREHAERLKQRAVEQGWKYSRLHPFLAKIWNPQWGIHRHPGVEWTWPFIDIALYDRIESHKVILVEFDYCRQFKPLPISEMLPTQRYPFGPLMLPIPKNPELFLDTVYKSWRTKALSNYWNHRIEKLYPEPQVWANISELRDKFTFYNV